MSKELLFSNLLILKKFCLFRPMIIFKRFLIFILHFVFLFWIITLDGRFIKFYPIYIQYHYLNLGMFIHHSPPHHFSHLGHLKDSNKLAIEGLSFLF